MATVTKGSSLCFAVSQRQARGLFVVVWVTNTLLVAANLALAAGWRPPRPIYHQLSMDLEASFGAWYPSMLLFLLCLCAGIHLLMDRRAGVGGPGLSRWLPLAALALLLSADEVCGLHERFDHFYKHSVSEHLLGRPVNWTVALLPFIVAAVALLIRFCSCALGRQPKARRLALAGLACWVAAVALEMLEWVILGDTVALRLRAFEPALEEALELVGTTLLLHAAVTFAFFQAEGWRRVLLAPPD